MSHTVYYNSPLYSGGLFIFSTLLIAVFAGCRPDPIHETIWIPALPPISDGDLSVESEDLGEITGIVDASHGTIAYQSNDDIVLLNPWFSSEFRHAGQLQGVLSVHNTPLLFTDDGVYWLQEDAFEISPFSSIWSRNYQNGLRQTLHNCERFVTPSLKRKYCYL